jgi:aryl-alcohol dehydrogenase-like predicted oxidoreductase
VNQLPYNLLCRAIEFETMDACVENGIGIIAYMTLLQGILADIYPNLQDVPPWQRRTRHFNCKATELCRHKEAGAEEETNRALAGIRNICRETGMSMPELALKWAVADQRITCALAGARNQSELESNVQAIEKPLDKAIVEKLNMATEELKMVLENHFDYYENKLNDRTK